MLADEIQRHLNVRDKLNTVHLNPFMTFRFKFVVKMLSTISTTTTATVSKEKYKKTKAAEH